MREINNNKKVALYHIVWKHENFEKTARILFEMVQQVSKKFPNKKRSLYLDIEGHRNKEGGFDNDMYELQRHFILEFLQPYISEVHMPLGGAIFGVQREDLPDEFKII